MTKDIYHMSDEMFATFTKKYPDVKRSDIEDIFAQGMFAATAEKAQRSEIEGLKNKAIGSMGTSHEMKFSDIESGMLKASLADGRQALEEIIGKIPIEAPRCSDGTKMENQGSKKKHHDNAGAN